MTEVERMSLARVRTTRCGHLCSTRRDQGAVSWPASLRGDPQRSQVCHRQPDRHDRRRTPRVVVTSARAPADRFALVLGAVGLRSTVRRLVFGPEHQFRRSLAGAALSDHLGRYSPGPAAGGTSIAVVGGTSSRRNWDSPGRTTGGATHLPGPLARPDRQDPGHRIVHHVHADPQDCDPSAPETRTAAPRHQTSAGTPTTPRPTASNTAQALNPAQPPRPGIAQSKPHSDGNPRSSRFAATYGSD
jgi:hypothetical protein